MSKVITAEQAAALIKDSVTLGAAVCGLAGWPDEIAIAIEKRFLATGHPGNLTLVHGTGAGNFKTKGPQYLAHEGLISKLISAISGASPGIAKMVSENKMEAYCLPQGVIIQLFREIAAKRPGIISKVGLDTFIDPRIEGGKMNQVTEKDIVELINLGNEEYLWYKTFPIDVAIIRGTTADEKGNLTMEKEGVMVEALPLAQAAKNSGGIVIAQVEYLAEAGSLHPKEVQVPGVLVDYIVVAENPQENHWQGMSGYFNPAFTGDLRVPLSAVPPLPMDERLIVARRAAMELPPNAVVNLGIGMPLEIGTVVSEEGVIDQVTMTTEVGSMGGVPAAGLDFGMAYNTECMVDHQNQFDWYDGGGLDVAFLGLAQTDQYGNVNVSKFKGKANGCGGFINITQNAKKVVYCGSFTVGGLKVTAEDGKLVILQEGRGRKFLEQVEQISFSGKYATKVEQPVLYVTERAVLRLENGEMTLIEIAPGIDLEKDVLAFMDFKPRISPDLKTMPSEIFQPKWGGLRQIIEANEKG